MGGDWSFSLGFSAPDWSRLNSRSEPLMRSDFPHPSRSVPSSFTGFYLVFLGFTWFYWVLPSFVIESLERVAAEQRWNVRNRVGTGLVPGLEAFHRVLLGFT